MAVIDYFLKIEGVEGESRDNKHKNELEILSFSWGVQQMGAGRAGGGAGAGKVTFQDFRFTMPVSKASPKLFLACASGEHLKSAVLSARKAGGQAVEFFRIKMTDILVSSFQTGAELTETGYSPIGERETVPLEQVSLNFAKFEVEYQELKADGSLGSPVKAGWDIKTNQKV